MSAISTTEAPSRASGRAFLGLPELYKPAFGVERCDLCGEVGALARIVLEPGHHVVVDGKKVWRGDRIAYVCRRHRGEESVGRPVATPNLTMAPGTSRLRPQKERLFDDGSLRRGGRR